MRKILLLLSVLVCCSRAFAATYVPPEDQVSWVLPPKVYAVIGQQFNLYPETLLQSFEPAENYTITSSLTFYGSSSWFGMYPGLNSRLMFLLTPNPFLGHPESLPSTGTLTLRAWHNGQTVATATCGLTLTDTSVSSSLTLGNTAAGNASSSDWDGKIVASDFVAPSSGSATSMSMRVSTIYAQSVQFKLGIYDSGGTLLGTSAFGDWVSNDSWVTVDMSPAVTVSSGETYRLAAMGGNDYLASVTTTTSSYVASRSYGSGFPSTYPAATTTTGGLSIYATVDPTPVRKILVLGDSTGAEWIPEMLRLSNSGNAVRFEPVGTFVYNGADFLGGNTQNILSESRSGESTNWYYTNVNSPIVFSGTCNIPQYFVANPTVTLGANDWWMIKLGINDLRDDGAWASDALMTTRIARVLSQWDAMIAQLKTLSPVPRIAVCDLSAFSYDRFTYAPSGRERLIRSRLLLNRAIHAHYASMAGVTLIPIGYGIDWRHSFPTATLFYHFYDTVGYTGQADNAHPAPMGYYQMAAMIYAALRAQEP